MPTENILFEKKDHVAIITLNRPEVLNAMTGDMFKWRRARRCISTCAVTRRLLHGG